MSIQKYSDYVKKKENQVSNIQKFSDYAKQNNIVYNPPKKNNNNKNNNGLLSAFNDGYDFGDITKTAVKGVKQLSNAMNTTRRELMLNPVQTLKTAVVSTAHGINKAGESIDNALSDFGTWITGREEQKRYELSLNELNNLIKNGTPEEKQIVLNKYLEEYGENSSSYQYMKTMLTAEDTRPAFLKKIGDAIGNVINKKYYETDTYKNYSNGKMTPGQKNIWNIGENIGNMLPSMAVSTVTGVPVLGSAVFFTQAQQNYTEEAKTRGYEDKDARTYGLIMGGLESLVERLGFDQLGGLKKMSQGNLLKSMVGEGLEEFVMPYIDSTIKSVGYNEKFDLQGTTEEAIKSAVSGAIVGGIMNLGGQGFQQVDNLVNKINNNHDITSDDILVAVEEIQKTNPEYFDEIIEELPKVLDDKTIAEIQEKTNQKEVVDKKILPTVNDIVAQEQNNNTNNIVKNDNQTHFQQSTNTNKFQYMPTNNSKKNTFMQSASRYLDNSKESISLVNTINKIIEDKEYNVILDNRLTNGINGQITTLNNGEVEIRLNPTSKRAVEFLLIHEVSHAVKTQEMIDLVYDYASKNPQFYQAVKSIEQQYGKDLTSEEVFADVCGQLFGNQEFINNLSVQKPSLFRQIYNKIIEWANKLTGNSKYDLFKKNIKNMWETEYRNTNSEQAVNNLNNKTNFSKQFQDILLKNKNLNPTSRIQIIYSNEKIDTSKKNSRRLQQNFKDNIKTGNYENKATGYIASITSETKGKILRPNGSKTATTSRNYILRMISANELPSLFENAVYIDTLTAMKGKALNQNELGYHHFVAPINIEGHDYRVLISGKEKQNSKKLYSLNIEILPQKNGNVPLANTNSGYQSSGTLPSDMSISDLVQNVNIYNYNTMQNQVYNAPDIKYSMQENTSNTQELENSSFSLKQKQLDIILENNPMIDDYHTGIRTIDDIKTLEETLNDGEWTDYDEFNPDLTKQDIERAINSGKITIYSSYPIEQGIFVSPSKMEAESYSSDGKVYSKLVNINDVAWIDPTQGQYAKVDNVKYSHQNDTWQEHLEKNYKTTGTRTYFPNILAGNKNTINMPPVENNTNESKVLNPLEISKLRPKDANTTPTLPDRTYNKNNDGNSHFFENIRTKTNMLNENQKNVILNEDDVKYYDKITNKVTLEKAFDRLNENGSMETENWFGKKSKDATAIDVAEGWILLKQYADKNNADGMVAVAKKLRDMGTKAGQTVQAFNIMERMSPEGMVKYAQSELSEAYDKMVKNKSREWIEKYRDDFDLKPEEVSFIMKTMEEVQQMEDSYEKRVKLAEIQKVMTDKLPSERGAGIKAWMRISMLFNPKTQVRNVMGNAVIAPVNYFSDLFSGIVDNAISKKTGVRTIGKTDLKSYAKGFKTGLYQSYNDFKKGINTRDINGNRFEIGQGKSFNDNTKLGKSLNRVDSLLSFMLDAGDRGFYEASFTNSINNQLVLNNTTEVTQEMIDIATQEALSRTWQDNNDYTKFVLQTRSTFNKINIKGYGLGDILIPFAKTPANLTKAIVDYSPAGLVKTIIDGNNLRKSLTNGQYNAQLQHQFVQELGKATAGTMLYILGYALAKAGIVSGESDDDKDTRDFIKNTLGVSSYSIKIGNKSFTYDWAQPISAPLSIMANYVQKQKENASILENATSSLDEGFNIILQQSFFESINNVFSETGKVPEKIIEELLGLPSRAIPTLMKQIVDLTDSTQRQTFEYDQPLKTAINKVKAKVPILSKTLSPSVDTMGREIQKYGGKNNIFNVLINPANVNIENISDSAKEIYRLYKSTGETNIMPRVAPYYINQSGEKITLNATQRTEYQKISGSIIETSIADLLKNTKYKNMNDTEKAEVINKIVNYSYNKAREDVLNIPMSNEYNKINMHIADGGKVSDYYLNKEEIDYSYSYPGKYKTIKQITTYDKYLDYQDRIDNVKDNYDNTNQRKSAVINYVNSLKLSIPQKAMLIKLNYSSYDTYNKQIIEYIVNQKLTATEKSEILTKLGFTVKDGRVYY